MKVIGSLVNGKEKKTKTASFHTSPVLKSQWLTAYQADNETIEEALKAIEIPSLQKMTAYQRSLILDRIVSLLEEEKPDIAKLITLETGKPIREATNEVDYTASYFKWFSEEAKRVYGMEIPSQFSDKRLFLKYEPIGPSAIITPWNFPIAMAGRKIAAAFAAGCPIIAKPSPETPASLITLGTLCLKAGIPKEALQILIGNEKKIGKAFLNAPSIRKLSFTGSLKIGQYLYRGCAQTLKKMTMELGGNAPCIIFDDADLEKALEGTLIAKFRQSGQTCICVNRLFVQKNIYSKFLEGFIEKVKQLPIGNPLEELTYFSYAIHPLSEKKTKAHIKEALSKGAKTHLGATKPYEPEILTNVTDDMLIFNEETFGPVAAIASFEDQDEVIRRANQTPYGLAAYVFTEGLQRSETICHRLQFGMIGLNDGSPSSAQLPFGGIKASGLGREGGPTGIYEYLTEKIISQKL